MSCHSKKYSTIISFILQVIFSIFITKKQNPMHLCTGLWYKSGRDLLSRAVTSQVSSALRSLTAVFGMGTGVSFSSYPPETLNRQLRPAASDCASAVLLYNNTFRSKQCPDLALRFVNCLFVKGTISCTLKTI